MIDWLIDWYIYIYIYIYITVITATPKWQFWPPVKSKLFNRLTHNLSGLIMSTRGTSVPKCGKNPFTGDFWGKGWNITFCVTFFSRTNVEKRPLDGFWRAMAQTTRNRARMCHFGVIKWKNWNLTPIYPQNPKNLALNRQFPAKMSPVRAPGL